MNNETFQSFIAHAKKYYRRQTKYSGSSLHISALLLPAFSPTLLPPTPTPPQTRDDRIRIACVPVCSQVFQLKLMRKVGLD